MRIALTFDDAVRACYTDKPTLVLRNPPRDMRYDVIHRYGIDADTQNVCAHLGHDGLSKPFGSLAQS
ncbi:hypothetical protein GCM10007886_10450 [Methylobacterium gregans]|nr:hypothetical protein GCM10007886_10450 [Methylobacterium gregans]